jgi:hypothetical protein
MKPDRTRTCTLLLWLMLGCAADAANNLIVPGVSIGQTHLGKTGASELQKLPVPTASEGGMSQSRQVWVDPKSKNTLYIYTAQPGDSISVQLIRVTSPFFRTKGGIKSGSTLSQILRQYSRIQAVGDQGIVYDDSAIGIAFEFPPNPNQKSRCLAVMIHPPGQHNYATTEEVRSVLGSGG